MSSIDYHIFNLLFEQDCVVVPNFGGFITNYKKATLEEGKISPTSRWVAFNGLLNTDDGLLTNYIAKVENVSREEASKHLKSFVDGVKTNLYEKQVVTFNKIGSFSANQEDKVVFFPDNGLNFYAECFGLPSILATKRRSQPMSAPVVHAVVKPALPVEASVQPLVTTDRQPVMPSYPRKKIKLLPALATLLVAVLIGVWSLRSKSVNRTNLGSVLPFTTQDSEKNNIQPEVNKPAAQVPSEPLPQAVEEKTSNDTKVWQYFVIVGSYSSRENAEKYLMAIKEEGFTQALIIVPTHNEKLFKVAASVYTEENLARSKATEFKKTLSTTTWVFKTMH